jgi:hypothetical protein
LEIDEELIDRVCRDFWFGGGGVAIRQISVHSMNEGLVQLTP